MVNEKQNLTESKGNDDLKNTIEIDFKDYINLRNTINELQTENYRLRAIVDSIKVVMKNSGIV